MIEEQKALGVPFMRLHDCGWPNPDVVNIHAVFPDPDADPTLPESYDFRLTDEYIAAVRKTGAEAIYRLGESIEHTRSSGTSTRPPTRRNGRRSPSGSSGTTTRGGPTGSITTSGTGRSGTSRRTARDVDRDRRRLPAALPPRPRRPSRSGSRR